MAENEQNQEEVKPESNILFTYDREEEFLRVLKQLNKLLN